MKTLNPYFEELCKKSIKPECAALFFRTINASCEISYDYCYGNIDDDKIAKRTLPFFRAGIVEKSIKNVSSMFGFEAISIYNEAHNWPFVKIIGESIEFTISKVGAFRDMPRSSVFRLNLAQDGQLSFFDDSNLVTEAPNKIYAILKYGIHPIDKRKAGFAFLSFPDDEMKHFHYELNLDLYGRTALSENYNSEMANIIKAAETSLKDIIKKNAKIG